MEESSSFLVSKRQDGRHILIEIKMWRPISEKYIGIGCDQIDMMRAKVIDQLDKALEVFRNKIKLEKNSIK